MTTLLQMAELRGCPGAEELSTDPLTGGKGESCSGDPQRPEVGNAFKKAETVLRAPC
jgi:hypothetical protein